MAMIMMMMLYHLFFHLHLDNLLENKSLELKVELRILSVDCE